ncbi:hypothetical protein CDG76_11870 [Nostoc sp. 'Peltigera membranacea cyanobiont' 210A]|uniref:di-heme oxidoredictase family protein n=1 Tax=Nostoc sp. 'Peltigera membranacea cyanobiont' 210A TaxID=2014529 RepID=UPI000B95670B|nr:di-heme oxidoredictase family protein [Nostoc sp. 'Peltigera membranacea cyanobiont' 210A]OYD95629.1 hypothetical protein CDG76_11870 [Nostoc sp. 'Peltigera membranacea cyanobiont' 210A]
MKQKKNPKTGVLRVLYGSKTKLFLLICVFIISVFGILLSNWLMMSQIALAKIDLLQPAPTQPPGYYDYFGKLLSPQEASQLVANKGLNPNNPISYQRVGAVKINKELIAQGEDIFLNRKIGDTFGLQGVFGLGQGFTKISNELGVAIANLRGQSTTNLKITLQKDLTIGSRTFPKGTVIPTGLKIPKGQSVAVGTTPNGGNITCALCHATLSSDGKTLSGVPNGELAIPLFIALSPNTAAGFARLNFNPLDSQYKGNGKTIIDSKGNKVELPDPEKFEKAFDDAVLDVPFGHFESSPDGIRNTTQIPSLFTFKNHPYAASGEGAVGPFAGLSALNNGVHSSEINLLAAAQLSADTLGIDPEVYIGTFLQNAAVKSLRLPEGVIVKPSEWLRKIVPNPTQAELEDQISVPGTGTYPNLRPSLLTFNGLVFSPNTGKPADMASGTFLFASNAMSAFQNSLVPPANQTSENWQALNSNSVKRGAKVFEKANCATCHIPPFFTDNKIHPIDEIRTNPARAQSRLGLSNLLVPPKLYTFNTPVPIPAKAEVLDVPTQGISDSPTTLPKGILPKGGYKTTSLRGLYLSAPYLHDGGVAVRAGSLKVDSNAIAVVDKTGLGLSGTLSRGIPADPASSLRALVDRNLRALVVKANKANPSLVRSNLDGTGHYFYVDRQSGFNSNQQTDLINFLLALDDNPGSF